MLNSASMNEIQIAIRVPGDVQERADALCERLRDHPDFRLWRVTRSAVLRLALIKGLEALEAEHAAPKPRKPKGA